jgi:ring-1,2-phenylacetyl-CoA epoxidase subunit PaaA
MVRICKEENFHKKQGYELVAGLANGTKEQREMAQDAVNRWWWPSLMMFGPSDKDSPNSPQLMKWKIKKESNDTLRQRFVNLTVPQAKAINLTIPDPDLKFNEETGNWDYGKINWDEFYEVIKGNGPCNKQRLEARNQAYANGEWVREAARVYAEKHNVQ